MCLCIHSHRFVYTDICAPTGTVYKGTGQVHDMKLSPEKGEGGGEGGTSMFFSKVLQKCLNCYN